MNGFLEVLGGETFLERSKPQQRDQRLDVCVN